MTQKIKRSDYLLLLPTLIPFLLLFLVPLVYSFQLVFSTPIYDGNGKEVYTDGVYDYFYMPEENRYAQTDRATGEPTGEMLRPYDIKAGTDTYKQVKTWGLDNFKRFFSDSRYYCTIWNTFRLVIPMSICQFIVAFMLAYFLRRKIKGKYIYRVLIIFPLTLGSLILAAGMTNFFRSTGWFNMLLMGLGIIDEPIKILYTYWGSFIAGFITGVAFLFSSFLGICEGIDTNLEIAAQTLGANKVKTFCRVFLPIVMPAMLSVFAINLVMNFGMYPSAVLVGDPVGSTRLFAVAAFEEFQTNFNYNMAATISFILTAVQVAILFVMGRVRRLFYIGYGGSFK